MSACSRIEFHGSEELKIHVESQHVGLVIRDTTGQHQVFFDVKCAASVQRLADELKRYGKLWNQQ